MNKRKYKDVNNNNGDDENQQISSRKRFKDEKEETQWSETRWERLHHKDFASEDELRRRIYTINNEKYHYNDPQEHLILNIGDIIANQYQVIGSLGEGTFGKVLQCKVLNSKQVGHKEVAIKVIKDQEKYKKAAFIELNTLILMHERDPGLQKFCVPILDWFAIGQHVCIVYPKLGPSLYSFHKRNNFRPIKMELIRDFAWQMLSSLALLHHQRIIHTDLKPENILLTKGLEKYPSGWYNPITSSISIVDFGSATFERSYHSSVIATRYYRPPEVIFGIGWSYSADIWSIGCILMELYTGYPPFNAHNDLTHAYIMERMLDIFPSYFFDRHCNSFTRMSDGGIVVPENTRRKYINTLRLRDIILEDDVDFYDLLKKMFIYSPHKRITAVEALRHDFFSRISAYQSPRLSLPSLNDDIKILSDGDVYFTPISPSSS